MNYFWNISVFLFMDFSTITGNKKIKNSYLIFLSNICFIFRRTTINFLFFLSLFPQPQPQDVLVTFVKKGEEKAKKAQRKVLNYNFGRWHYEDILYQKKNMYSFQKSKRNKNYLSTILGKIKHKIQEDQINRLALNFVVLKNIKIKTN